MEKLIRNTPDAILTADWHLRDTAPSCREQEEFMSSQWNKVNFITHLQQKYDCPVLHAGDLFDNWKPSPFLLAQTLINLPQHFHTIYGNHDLPQHSLELQNKTGIHVLYTAYRLKLFHGLHWLQEPNNYQEYVTTIKGRKILLRHIMTHQGSKPFPGSNDTPAGGLLRSKKYKGIDLIVTGHNHKSFVEEYNGNLLVNPGAITRQDSDEGDVIPCVYLYYAETNSVRRVDLPCLTGVVSKPENVQRTEDRTERISAFINKLEGGVMTDLDFDKNLESFYSKNNIEKEIIQIISQATDA
jgi:DNA repair exonuclease SbcCD nuclease subunit